MRSFQVSPKLRASQIHIMKIFFTILIVSFLSIDSALPHRIDGPLYRGESEGDVPKEQESPAANPLSNWLPNKMSDGGALV
jgi:hypothetical protein